MNVNARISRAAETELVPSRRPGIRHRRLLDRGSPSHHVILAECDAGAEVELHAIHTSESLYFLEGTYTLRLPEGDRPLGPGDLVHFPTGTTHGLTCHTPGRYLAIFAPSNEST